MVGSKNDAESRRAATRCRAPGIAGSPRFARGQRDRAREGHTGPRTRRDGFGFDFEPVMFATYR